MQLDEGGGEGMDWSTTQGVVGLSSTWYERSDPRSFPEPAPCAPGPRCSRVAGCASGQRTPFHAGSARPVLTRSQVFPGPNLRVLGSLSFFTHEGFALASCPSDPQYRSKSGEGCLFGAPVFRSHGSSVHHSGHSAASRDSGKPARCT